MRTVTLDEFAAVIANEPVSARTRNITVERMANVDAVLADSDMIGDVGDEHKPNGEAYKLATIAAAYNRIIADRKCNDRVAVRIAKVAGTVYIGHPDTLAAAAK